MFGQARERAALAPLYAAMVAEGRDPFWYREGQVPDTLDGRFDMIAAVTALVLLRLEAEGEAGRGPSVLLTETSSTTWTRLRQIGIGDYVVGKHVGRMMARSAAGSPHSAPRASRVASTRRSGATSSTIRRRPTRRWRFVAGRLERLAAGLDARRLERLLGGSLA